ncbi:MAG: hypothetical protein A2599_02740 [Candidatus Staskawiczbacteria bacterium RIFOXYD1_FULL_39_28]|uniref:NlpC/P60 domain-containing protein n=1 Tax=Candidatus Staskawiczbacteria bacterium RIFOXYC1_FULL_38_18 TaxID=1802229 RepID=A0A1G2JC10_9BACT|nr:MAG: hypothetical protein A2401_01240 [Candidatus Staskawiczbacteria bacterium RIFOXYC1_FULL_38_18]OGZ91028.1 MAG: hypothetical protein A2599_02740 [Candidatus Staskawiczbacteria bacterium RIFOXYD1_FULL_39_28]
MNDKEKLVFFAKQNLGKPYKYGAKPSEAPKTFDCSSFVQYIYKKVGIALPRTALEQAHLGKKVKPKREYLQIGDLIFIKGMVGRYNEEFPQGIGHVAMYIGDGKIIQAKYQKNKNGSDGGKVQVDSVAKIINRKNLVVIKRII